MGAFGCGPSEAACAELCEWRAQDSCSAPVDECMDRCQAASAAAAEDAKFCLDQSFGYCEYATCCLGFYYDDNDQESRCGAE